MKKQLIFRLTVLTIIGSLATNILVPTVKANAFDVKTNPMILNQEQIVKIDKNNSYINEIKELMNVGVFNEFAIKNNKLTLKDNVQIIQKRYNLNDNQLQLITGIIEQAPKLVDENIGSQLIEGTITSRVHVSNWKVYFTNNEVNEFFFAAASIGPASLYAAIVSVSTAIAGPAGTVLSTVASILGAASLSRLCYLILQANKLKKGIYIGVQWNGKFPNHTDGLW